MSCQGQIDFSGGHNGNKYLVTFLCYLGYINLYLPHHMLCTVYSIPNKSNQKKIRLLKDLRDKLATEACHVLKDYDGKLLYQRRKSETFADDIYHLGFSLLNKKPHVNLRKIFRKTNPEEEDILQEPNQVKPESPLNSVEVLETVAVLKEQIGELTTTVRDLRKRAESLENVLTENQIRELTMNNKITVNEDTQKNHRTR